MAQLFRGGGELQSVTAEGATARPGAVTFSSAEARLGLGYALAIVPAGVQHGLNGMATCVLNTDYYVRAYFKKTSNPVGGQAQILSTYDGAVNPWELQLQTNGTINVRARLSGSGTVSTVHTTAALNNAQWYRIEVHFKAATTTTGVLEVKIDGTTVYTSSTLNLLTAASQDVYIGTINNHNAAGAYTFYFDDWGLNDSSGANENSWLGDSKCLPLLAASDPATSHADWVKPGGATTNRHTSVDTPPGVTEAIDNTATSAEDYLTNVNAGGNRDLFITLQDYTAAGITGTIRSVQAFARTGQAAATTNRAGSLGLSSNPSIALTAFAAFDNGIASATVTTWPVKKSTVAYAPSPTLGTGPVINVRKVAANAQLVAVNLVGAWVDFVPATGPIEGAAEITGTGSITANGKAIRRGAGVAIGGSSSVTAAGKSHIYGSASISGSSSVSAAGKATRHGAGVTVSASSSVTAAGKAIRRGTGVAVASSSTVTATGRTLARGAGVTVSGSSSVTANGQRKANGAVSVAGTSAIAANGRIRAHGAVSVAGASSVSAAGRIRALGAAAIAGASSVTANGQREARGSASITGSSSVTANGQRTAISAAAIAGASSIVAAGRTLARGSASITGASSITANGFASGSVDGSASITGASSITATGRSHVYGSASISGVSSVAATGHRTGVGSASIAGTSALAGTGKVGAHGAGVTLTGASSVAANGQRTGVGRGVLVTGASSITAAGRKRITGSASIAGTGAITAAGRLGARGAASITGAGSVTANGRRTGIGSTSISGTGALTANGQRTGVGSASIASSSSVSASGRRTTRSAVTILASSIVTAAGRTLARSSVTLTAASAITALGRRRTYGAVTITGATAITAAGTSSRIPGTIGDGTVPGSIAGARPGYVDPDAPAAGTLELVGAGTINGSAPGRIV